MSVVQSQTNSEIPTPVTAIAPSGRATMSAAAGMNVITIIAFRTAIAALANRIAPIASWCIEVCFCARFAISAITAVELTNPPKNPVNATPASFVLLDEYVVDKADSTHGDYQ